MHSPDMIHYCPTCRAKDFCTIEDGVCDKDGKCSNCIRVEAHNEMSLWEYDEQEDY